MTRPRRLRSDAVQSPLETYLREINETPLLNAEEEKELAYRIEDGDSEARDRMVRANLRLVVNIARSYTGKTIRIPAYMVELLAKWRRATTKLQEELGRPPTQEEVAKSLNLPKKKLNIIK